MNKETSSRVSTIAAEVLRTAPLTDTDATAGTNLIPVFNKLLEHAKTLAGSCMSQDETAGQIPEHEPNFIERLKMERDELEGRQQTSQHHLEALGNAEAATYPHERISCDLGRAACGP